MGIDLQNERSRLLADVQLRKFGATHQQVML